MGRVLRRYSMGRTPVSRALLMMLLSLVKESMLMTRICSASLTAKLRRVLKLPLSYTLYCTGG